MFVQKKKKTAPKTIPKQLQNNLYRHHRCSRIAAVAPSRVAAAPPSPLPPPLWVGKPNMGLE